MIQIFILLFNLVAGPGIEPRTRAYETLEIPLLQPAIPFTVDFLLAELLLYPRLEEFLS